MTLPKVECIHCNQTFHPDYSGKKYCSRNCMYLHRASKMIVARCRICGRDFTHPAYKARTMCSRECQTKSLQCDGALITGECPECGRSFQYYRSWPLKYCSKGCYKSVMSRRITSSICVQCNNVFTHHTSDTRKYCSQQCSGLANIHNIPGIVITRYTDKCEQCGNEYVVKPSSTKGRFCSLKCYGEYMSVTRKGIPRPGIKPRAKVRVDKECPVCGVVFPCKISHLNRRICCSRKCGGLYQSTRNVGENNPAWRGGYKCRYGAYWARSKKFVRNRDGVCVNCGITPEENGKQLAVHHIIPFRIFGIERSAEANDPSNLVACCTDCHHILERQSRELLGEL